jgi:tRNA pseudouridine38-40 synthase
LRYFFHLGYLGTNYSGWQKHPDGLSVQQVLEEALSQIFKTPMYITGCGRTDAQVHASQFFFHIDVEREWDYDLLFRLNKLLPDDIAVFDIIPMEGQPHARFDAVERSYDYFIHTYKDPFLGGLSAFYAVKNGI